MTVPISGPVAVAQECRYCTVPVDDGSDTCTFCRSYTPPVGADPALADGWQPRAGEHPGYRCIWSPSVRVAGLDVRGVVVQLADGRVVTDGDDGPHVFVGDGQYTPAEARALAAAVTATADRIERWAAEQE